MSDRKSIPTGREVLYNFLEKHNTSLSVPGDDWAQNNWYNVQSVTDAISTLRKDARLWHGKGKSIICAVLGASLVVAVETRDRQRSANPFAPLQ